MQSAESAEPKQDAPGQVVVASQSGIVGLAAKLSDIKDHFGQFETLKKELLNENDYYTVKGKDGKSHQAIGKSGWYKFGVAFNISTYIIKEEKEWLNDEHTEFAYHITMQASAPNGRNVADTGSCDNTSKDREGASIHVVRAMASTRAKERCMITMVGAPEKATDDGSTTNGNATAAGEKFCTCDTPDITPDKKGCRECHKSLHPNDVKVD